MKRGVRIVNWFVRCFFQVLCKIDAAELDKIPLQGPYILVGNHINFLEAPILLSHLDPRPVTGIAKKESWDNPLFNFLFNRWEIIPIERGLVDREAFQLAIQALAQDKILAISPEGTRSKDGCLLQGKPGVVILAVKSGAPLIPIAFFGYENFWTNLKHLRRTDFHIAVGKPFWINTGEAGLTREARQIITDEIMFKIAELLPERNQGYYKDIKSPRYSYLAEM